MKKVIALLLTLCVSMSLMACVTITKVTESPAPTATGDVGNVTTEEPTTAPSDSPVDPGAPVTDPGSDPVNNPGGETTAEIEAIPVTVSTLGDVYKYDECWDDFLGYTKYPCLYYYDDNAYGEEAKYAKVTEGLEVVMDEIYDKFIAAYQNVRARIDEDYVEGEVWQYGVYKDVCTTYLLRADSVAVSFAYEEYSYFGGAHPYLQYGAYTIDSKTGEVLTIGDVVNDVSMLPAAIAKAYCDAGNIGYELDELKEKIEAAYEGESDLEYVFGLDNSGVNFYFGDYVLGSYAEGSQIIHVPYDAFDGLFNKKYTKTLKTYFAPLADCGVTYTTDNAGNTVPVSIYTYENEGGYTDTCYAYVISTGDYATNEISINAYGVTADLVHFENGKNYVYVSIENASGPNSLDVYEVRNGKIYAIDSYEDTEIFETKYTEDGNATKQLTDPSMLRVYNTFYLPGCNSLYRAAFIDPETGKLVCNQEDYSISSYAGLVCQTEVYGRELNDGGEYTGNIRVFEAGEVVIFRYTDKESYIAFVDENERLYSIPVSVDDWGDLYYDDGENTAGLYDLFMERYDDYGYGY